MRSGCMAGEASSFGRPTGNEDPACQYISLALPLGDSSWTLTALRTAVRPARLESA